MQALESLISFLVKKAVQFRNLQTSKILKTDTNRIFPVPLKVKYMHVFEIYSLKKNFAVNNLVICMG